MQNDVIKPINHKINKLTSHKYREEEQNQMLANACNSVNESEQVKRKSRHSSDTYLAFYSRILIRITDVL